MDDFEATLPQPDVPEPRRRPWQEEMPFAVVDGEPVVDLPRDLYIPPDALEVFLEAFEGPLDLLLYLVKRQNLDILDIPIATITRQYMEYIDLMKELRLELAAEYLAMAAMLAEIKSRLLLPQPETIDDEDDPRAELLRRLQEYERYKQAAERLDELPRIGRDLVEVRAATPYVRIERPQPRVELDDLLAALADVLARAESVPPPPGADGMAVGPRAHVHRAGAGAARAFRRVHRPVHPARRAPGRGGHPARAAGAASGIARRHRAGEAVRADPRQGGGWRDGSRRGGRRRGGRRRGGRRRGGRRRGGETVIRDELVLYVEAALLSAGRPVEVDELVAMFEGRDDAPDRSAVREAVAALVERWRGRALEVTEVASGFRAQVRKEFSQAISTLWQERPARYSRALLETLALIAYRQPVSRGEIEEVRGVSVSSSIMKTLTEREWVRVVGHREAPGRPALFGTTKHFLDTFNLEGLAALPPLAELRDLEDPPPDLFAPVSDMPADEDAASSAAAPNPDAGAGDGDVERAG